MNIKNKIIKIDDKYKKNKVFGIGLPKTGTTSLTKALEKLDYNVIQNPHLYRIFTFLNIPVKHWNRRLFYFKKDEYKHLLELFPLIIYSLKLIDFKSWDSLTNFGEHIYPLLDKEFPNSKFVVTIRDKDSWLESIKFYMSHDVFYQSHYNTVITLFTNMAIYNSCYFNEEYFSLLYDNHLRNIKYYFRNRSEDLLIINICEGEGWEKLCPFLGKDVINSSFPHRNKCTEYE